MGKNAIYITILIVILLIVSGTWYVKQSQAAKSFSYQGINYNCEETQTVADDSPTVIKLTQQADGTIMIAHNGQEYKCKTNANATKPADIVLDNSVKGVRVVISDTKGNDVEVKNAQLKMNAYGNVVVFNEQGMSIQMEDGGSVQVGANGNVNINTSAGSVQTGTVNPTTGARAIKATTKEGSVQTKDDGSMDIKTPEGSVQMQGDGSINVQTSAGGVQLQGWGTQSTGSTVDTTSADDSDF